MLSSSEPPLLHIIVAKTKENRGNFPLRIWSRVYKCKFGRASHFQAAETFAFCPFSCHLAFHQCTSKEKHPYQDLLWFSTICAEGLYTSKGKSIEASEFVWMFLCCDCFSLAFSENLRSPAGGCGMLSKTGGFLGWNFERPSCSFAEWHWSEDTARFFWGAFHTALGFVFLRRKVFTPNTCEHITHPRCKSISDWMSNTNWYNLPEYLHPKMNSNDKVGPTGKTDLFVHVANGEFVGECNWVYLYLEPQKPMTQVKPKANNKAMLIRQKHWLLMSALCCDTKSRRKWNTCFFLCSASQTAPCAPTYLAKKSKSTYLHTSSQVCVCQYPRVIRTYSFQLCIRR